MNELSASDKKLWPLWLELEEKFLAVHAKLYRGCLDQLLLRDRITAQSQWDGMIIVGNVYCHIRGLKFDLARGEQPVAYEVQSRQMQTLYGDWLATATFAEIEFVDRVYQLAEQNYSGGGDVIVETYSPSEILDGIDDLNDAREVCGLWVEQNLNARYGADDDTQLKMSKNHRKWKRRKKKANMRNPRKAAACNNFALGISCNCAACKPEQARLEAEFGGEE